MDNRIGIPFQYTVQTAALAAAAAVNVPLTLDQDSYFQLVSYHGTGSADNATDIEPLSFSVMIQETTGRLYMSLPLSNRIVCPRSGMRLPLVPVDIAPGTNFQFTFVNLSGAANIITFVLNGFKKFI